MIVITLSKKISAPPAGNIPHLKQIGCEYPCGFVYIPVKPKSGDGVNATFDGDASGTAQSVESCNEQELRGQSTV